MVRLVAVRTRRQSAAKIAVSHENRARLRRVLEAALPRECCGVLLGVKEQHGITVHSVVSTLNVATLIGGFTIPDEEIRRARLVASRRGQSIVAVFHSHPGGPTLLSEADQEAISYSEWPWVIISEGRGASEIKLEYHAIPD
jgi:proteasome lid subunit RPN8/RPN11